MYFITPFLYILYSYVLFTSASTFDLQQLNTCVWLSGAAYCGKENYTTMHLSGPVTNFVYDGTLVDNTTDLQGFVGTMDTTIYVVFRGSSSAMNWLDDFEILQVKYDTFPECNCSVHYGFYQSALGVQINTLYSIHSIRETYPDYSIIVTGHSYGAAVALLVAMELVRAGYHDIKVYNYGQPRVGDDAFATFVNSVFAAGDDYVRVTHNRDIVPHLPPTEGFGYYHSCGELFENGDGNLTICSDTVCEDTNCSSQYSLNEATTADHSVYLGHELSCGSSVV